MNERFGEITTRGSPAKNADRDVARVGDRGDVLVVTVLCEQIVAFGRDASAIVKTHGKTEAPT